MCDAMQEHFITTTQCMGLMRSPSHASNLLRQIHGEPENHVGDYSPRVTVKMKASKGGMCSTPQQPVYKRCLS